MRPRTSITWERSNLLHLEQIVGSAPVVPLPTASSVQNAAQKSPSLLIAGSAAAVVLTPVSSALSVAAENLFTAVISAVGNLKIRQNRPSSAPSAAIVLMITT